MTPDICVIGGGTAGYAAALGAAALGWRCTLIDPAAELGRSQAADLAESILFAMARDARGSLDAGACRARIGRALAMAAPDSAAARLRALGVTVLRGEASFLDARSIAVDGERITARRFIVATGTRAEPPARAQAHNHLLTPATLLAGSAPWPTALTILTETPDGFAWAQALARCGVAVTLEAKPDAGAPFDPELMALCVEGLRRDGVVLRTRPDGGVPPPAEAEDTRMVFARARPAIAGLDLARAGVAVAEGAPLADRALRTRNRRIFVIGDVLGRPALGGAAIPVEVGVVLRALVFRMDPPRGPAAVPLLLRTMPALAQVGEMRHGSKRRVTRFPVSPEMPGLVKVVAAARGVVEGAAVLAPTAADAIGPWTLAIRQGLTLSAMAGMPVPAETVAEAGRRAATTAVTAQLRAPWIRRVSAWLRRLP